MPPPTSHDGLPAAAVAVGDDPLSLALPVERARPRGVRFLAASTVVLLLVAALAYGLVALLVAERGESLHAALRSRLEALAAGRAEVIAARLDGVAQLGQRLSRSDLVRLYAHEAGLSRAGEPLGAALAAQAPYMQRLIDGFAAQHGLAGAALVGRDGRLVLASPGGGLADGGARRRALAAAAGSGPGFTPLREGLAGLVMDVVLPVAVPQSLAERGRVELAGALVMTVPATARLAEILRPGPLHQPGERVHLLQAGDDGRPREAILDGAGVLRPLPAVAGGIAPGGPLPYARLTAPDGVPVLAVGVPVAGLPWTVVQEVEAATALAPLHGFRLTAAAIAALAALALALAFTAFWWRQIGGHHRELAVQYRDLAARIHKQRRLLESITGTIREMIGLKTPDGRYAYVNPAFARWLGRPVDMILGRSDGDLFDEPAVTERLAGSDRRALEGGTVEAEEGELDLDGRRYHLQTSKVPLRDEGGGVVGIVAVARDVTELVEQRRMRERAVQQAVQALVRAIELRDPYLVGHSRRVEAACAEVARRLELSEPERTTLRLAASLCQIGKIFIPAEILAKPGRHTVEETRVMQGHIDHALRVLGEIDFELPVAEAIHQMYERLDGTGYPRGLRDGEIDLLARVLGAVDVFCARTAPRGYRGRIGAEQALHQLARHPDRYDARVVEALRAVIEAAPPDEGESPEAPSDAAGEIVAAE